MDKVEIINETVTKLMHHLGIRGNVIVEEKGDEMYVKVEGENLSLLIGYKGQTLDAMQDFLSHVVFAKTNQWQNLVLDVNGYTDQRIDRLHNLAKRFIDRVRFFQAEVELPFLNAWERKQIHTYIGDYDDVESESRGDGRTRRLYLLPKKRK